jgi:hypothetical protein
VGRCLIDCRHEKKLGGLLVVKFSMFIDGIRGDGDGELQGSNDQGLDDFERSCPFLFDEQPMYY